MPHRSEIIEGDITRLDVDAIVNAANRTLLGGGGVDGAIHRAAGPELREACKALGGCATGEAKITPGFKLPARYVIHPVGPVWGGGERGEDRLLADCYRNSFALALRHGLTSIAYPAISTGAYRFPPDRAALIAVRTIHAALDETDTMQRVVFCCFGAESRRHHEAAFATLLGSGRFG
jgi:O-acetyl-ADP-ribose deacetylase (regulator of RNase III)